MTKTHPAIIPLDKKLSGNDLTKAFTEVCVGQWYSDVDNKPILQKIANSLIKNYCVETASDDPLVKAVQWIAIAAEHDHKKPYNAYHNPYHTAHVAMMMGYFCAQAKVSEKAFLKGLCAAFGHDIAHPGIGNPTDDIVKNERQSAKITTDIMLHCGVDEESIADVNVMILSTSPNGPHEYVGRIATATHRGWHCSMKPVLREQLRLIENPKLVELSAMLCDADIFISAGTNIQLM